MCHAILHITYVKWNSEVKGGAAVKVLLTGGGTGGHITPLLAVAHELKSQRPDVQLTYVGERGGKFLDMVVSDGTVQTVRLIHAGKFRRYHGESWLTRLLDVRTNLLNLRDAVFFCIGVVQAVWFMLLHRPDAVFIKGGFVGVPVGLAAALLRVPFVTHDSDTVPGLANRIIGRWARLHATAMPASFYSYPKSRVKHVGIPLTDKFKPVDDTLRAEYRKSLGIPTDARVLFITGGSQGAQSLNQIVAEVVPTLLADNKKLFVFHQAGKGADSVYAGREVPEGRLQVFEFAADLYRYSGAADVVVTRAGATSVAEFAVQGKACILVPHPFLTGGHQVKNAKHLEQAGAVLALGQTQLEKRPELLLGAVQGLLDDSTTRQRLVANLRSTAKQDAAQELAQVILGLGND